MAIQLCKAIMHLGSGPNSLFGGFVALELFLFLYFSVLISVACGRRSRNYFSWTQPLLPSQGPYPSHGAQHYPTALPLPDAVEIKGFQDLRAHFVISKYQGN
jgi:hypothetical protein